MALIEIKRAVFGKGQPIQREEWFDLCRANEPGRDVTTTPFREGDTITTPEFEEAIHEDRLPFAKRLASRRYIRDIDGRTATAGKDVAALLTVFWHHEQAGDDAEQEMKWWVSRRGSGAPRFWPTIREQYENIRTARES